MFKSRFAVRANQQAASKLLLTLACCVLTLMFAPGGIG